MENKITGSAAHTAEKVYITNDALSAEYIRENEELDRRYEHLAERRKLAAIYTAITVFCFVFKQIYYMFSHGVYSGYMTFLFAVPLLLGWLPAVIMWLAPSVRMPAKIASNAWHSGIAAVTVSFALRGIFDIAGTSSPYQTYLLFAGAVMLAIGAVSYLLRK